LHGRVRQFGRRANDRASDPFPSSCALRWRTIPPGRRRANMRRWGSAVMGITKRTIVRHTRTPLRRGFALGLPALPRAEAHCSSARASDRRRSIRLIPRRLRRSRLEGWGGSGFATRNSQRRRHLSRESLVARSTRRRAPAIRPKRRGVAVRGGWAPPHVSGCMHRNKSSGRDVRS
jgi:hypothetical protein